MNLFENINDILLYKNISLFDIFLLDKDDVIFIVCYRPFSDVDNIHCDMWRKAR